MLKLWWQSINAFILKHNNVFVILSVLIILLLTEDGPPTGT